MILFIRMAILWVSIVGYCLYLRKKNVNMAFAPVITLSFIGCVMFIAGLLNIMPLARYSLLFGGLVCGVIANPWRKAAKYTPYDYVCLLVFFGIMLLFGIRLHGEKSIAHDDFSHWMVVTRDMLRNDSMPNFKSIYVVFKGYPTGTAGFLYYVCRWIETEREDIMLFTQSWIYAASLCVLLGFVKRIRLSSIVIIIATAVYAITANVPITWLYVDSLLSFLMIASTAITIYYRKDIEKAAIYSLPIQIFLVAIKNSGFMMLINTMLLLYFFFQNRATIPRKNGIRLAIFHAGIPLFVFYLWNRHADYVYDNGLTSLHAMTLENYASIQKSPEDIHNILQVFCTRTFSWNGSWQMLLLILILLLIGYVVRKKLCKQRGHHELMIGIGVIGIYLVYMAAMAAMYVLSMSIGEALALASYSRYERTIIVYIVGVIVIYLLQLISALPNVRKKHIIELGATLGAILMLMTTMDTYHLHNLFMDEKEKEKAFTWSDRGEIDAVIEKYEIPKGSSYLLYGSALTPNRAAKYYIVRYLLESTSVRFITAESLDDDLTGYKYFIALGGDKNMDDFLQSKGFTLGEGVYELE